jgi:HK97 family phage prohead protease
MKIDPDHQITRFGYAFNFREDFDTTLQERLQDRATQPLEIRMADDGSEMTGYASVFGVRDSYGTCVEKGALEETIVERKNKIRVLHNHKSERVIGKPKKKGGMAEDDYGFYTKTDITQGVGWIDDVATQIRNGDIDGLSIGFWILESYWKTAAGDIKGLWDMSWEEYLGSTRHITKLKLAEWSATPFPSNEDARIDQIRTEIFGLHQRQSDAHTKLHRGEMIDMKQYQEVLNRLNEMQSQLAALQEQAAPVELLDYRNQAEQLRVALATAGDEAIELMAQRTGIDAQVIRMGLMRESRFMFDSEAMDEFAQTLGVTLERTLRSEQCQDSTIIINLGSPVSTQMRTNIAEMILGNAQVEEPEENHTDDAQTRDEELDFSGFELPPLDDLKR